MTSGHDLARSKPSLASRASRGSTNSPGGLINSSRTISLARTSGRPARSRYLVGRQHQWAFPNERGRLNEQRALIGLGSLVGRETQINYRSSHALFGQVGWRVEPARPPAELGQLERS